MKKSVADVEIVRDASGHPTRMLFGSRRPDLGVQSEHVEMVKLAEFLDRVVGAHGWLHIPNEGKRSRIAGARLKAAGMKPGAPDVLIFRLSLRDVRPMPSNNTGLMWPRVPVGFPATVRGVAIELKRKGATPSSISEAQRDFGAALASQGWYWFAAAGADAAIDELVRVGYGR